MFSTGNIRAQTQRYPLLNDMSRHVYIQFTLNVRATIQCAVFQFQEYSKKQQIMKTLLTLRTFTECDMMIPQ